MAEQYVSQDEVKQRELTVEQLYRETPGNEFNCKAPAEEWLNPRPRMPWRSEYPLTKKEKQIFTLLAKGFTREEIAEMMNMTRETVRRHIANGKKKWK